MTKYFTLLDNREEEQNPESEEARNSIGIAQCTQHSLRLAGLEPVPAGVDGGMIAAIVIIIAILLGGSIYWYRRRK